MVIWLTRKLVYTIIQQVTAKDWKKNQVLLI